MIKIIVDESNDMMEIHNDSGECVFYGNYWDITPSGVSSLLKRLGHDVSITNGEIEV